MFGLLIPRAPRRSALPALRGLREFDELFDELWRGLGAAPLQAGPAACAPPLDVHETAEALIVSAEVPGLAEQDVEVSLEGDVLTLKGGKRSETGEAGAAREGTRWLERWSGSFERRLALPGPVDAERVRATLRDGVLEVVLPKPEAAVRRVPVTS
jgi:HSP20 family protein